MQLEIVASCLPGGRNEPPLPHNPGRWHILNCHHYIAARGTKPSESSLQSLCNPGLVTGMGSARTHRRAYSDLGVATSGLNCGLYALRPNRINKCLKTPIAVMGLVEKTKEKKNTKMTLHPIQAMHQNQPIAGTLLDVARHCSCRNSILSPYNSIANTYSNWIHHRCINIENRFLLFCKGGSPRWKVY